VAATFLLARLRQPSNVLITPLIRVGSDDEGDGKIDIPPIETLASMDVHDGEGQIAVRLESKHGTRFDLRDRRLSQPHGEKLGGRP
jgi:hypothetical protein